jgi:hypothetical protein
VPSSETPSDKAKAIKALRTLSTINLLAMAGVIGLTTFLNHRAASSTTWKAISKLLP